MAVARGEPDGPCHDDASPAALQAEVSADPDGQDRQQLELITATHPSGGERALLLAETAKCSLFVRRHGIRRKFASSPSAFGANRTARKGKPHAA